MIISEINSRFCKELWDKYTGDWDRISRMSILCNNQVRMANLSVCGSHKINGVSKLHSDILKADIFNDFYRDTPDKFTNVTNGIAHRRWLCSSNPGLTALITELIGEGFYKNPEELLKLKLFENEETVLQRIGEIKKQNKINFSNRMAKLTGQIFDPDTVYDVQAKRMHEYKRQLLKALQIIDTYATLLENPDADIEPVTFMFAAKAFGGYYVAKEIIKLICSIAAEIEKNPKIRSKMRVVFFEDYRVSLAEHLLPSANLSEQISLAGKEASGTGNMKLMINGALTLGTLDGANVEIHEAVGDDNIFIFGLNSDDVKALWSKGYVSKEYYNSNPRIKRVVDMISKGFNGENFDHIANYLLNAPGVPDPYMCLCDFASYVHTFDLAMKKYRDQKAWNKSSLINTASAGRFAADRSIGDYAREIWDISPLK
jgi:starch phosphorylase